MGKNLEEVNPLVISQINVTNLFGRYSYKLSSQWNPSDEAARLLILYGDNGSGKTTLLRLIYHLLSPGGNEGHRNFLAKTLFNQISVTLSDGTRVFASREEGQISGSYRFGIQKPASTQEIAAQCEVSSQEVTLKKGGELVLEELASLKLGLYYLSDDREIEGTSIPRTRQRRDERFNEYIISYDYPITKESTELQRSLVRAWEWLQRQSFLRSTRGEQTIYSNYPEIVRTIVNDTKLSKPSSPSEITSFVRQMNAVASRSSEMAVFGLTPVFDDSEFRNILLRETPGDLLNLSVGLIKPFVDGISTRLDAMERIYRLITVFLNILNKFFKDKTSNFHIERGFYFATPEGDELSAENLSSGERHLLLLLCNALPARSQPSIYMIDEPELSLNVKWQRELVEALLAVTEQSSVQFILATHSVELLAGYPRYITPLENMNSDGVADARS